MGFLSCKISFWNTIWSQRGESWTWGQLPSSCFSDSSKSEVPPLEWLGVTTTGLDNDRLFKSFFLPCFLKVLGYDVIGKAALLNLPWFFCDVTLTEDGLEEAADGHGRSLAFGLDLCNSVILLKKSIKNIIGIGGQSWSSCILDLPESDHDVWSDYNLTGCCLKFLKIYNT